jgi:hypothetical protein
MDSDLLTAALALAERGWLGDDIACDDDGDLYFRSDAVDVTEADLHLAAHREIVRRKWCVTECGESNTIEIRSEYKTPKRGMGTTDWGVYVFYHQDGTTTLSLLRALLAACEAAESKEKTQ